MTGADQLREEGRKQGREQGYERGREQSQRECVLKLLSRRFGPLPGPILARIQAADFALLDRWFDRGITAPSLDAVFADEP